MISQTPRPFLNRAPNEKHAAPRAAPVTARPAAGPSQASDRRRA